MPRALIEVLCETWVDVAQHIADGHAEDFAGPKKEAKVLRRLCQDVTAQDPKIRIYDQYPFEIDDSKWKIDLLLTSESERIAIEGKYKTQRDGAHPDNRKAAFLDLYRLEQYVERNPSSSGLFLWLTDDPSYLKQAKGDSKDFSTHQGRVYEAGTPLKADRARSRMPIPLTLTKRYVFEWHKLTGHWNCLAIKIHTDS